MDEPGERPPATTADTLEVISVHVAKCGGVSLQRALQNAYGSEAVYLDYADRIADPCAPMNLDPAGFYAAADASGYGWTAGKRVVHGHFHIRKYARYPGRVRRITFLREPVAHRLSLYHFWRHMPRSGHTLQDYLLDNRLSVVEFVRMPAIRHFYERLYFAGAERAAFDFVGSVERFERDRARLAHVLGVPLHLPHLNAGPARERGPDEDAALRRELAALLADDSAFYRAWCGPEG